MVHELQGLLPTNLPFPAIQPQAPPVQPPTPPGVENVQTVMAQEAIQPSSVRRRLFGPETSVVLHDFIVAGRRVIRVALLCTQVLNYDYSVYGVRYDECNPATRFVICNGVNQTRVADAGLSGFTIHQGGLHRYTHYKSTRDDHLPPVIMGPLFLNDLDKVPEWARQHLTECKFFYMRDQKLRHYDSWKFGHRPVVSYEGESRNRCDITQLYTDAIKVRHQMMYQVRGSQIFHSLAMAFVFDCRLAPTIRHLGSQVRDSIDISPVWCSRGRVDSNPSVNYAEFDVVCALSYRKPEQNWRSGPLLFLTYRKTESIWSITDDSCAVFCSPEIPKYSRLHPYRGLVDDINAFYDNLP